MSPAAWKDRRQVFQHQLHGRHHIVEIQQRLPMPIITTLVTIRPLPGLESVVELMASHLADDFRGTEVALETLFAGGTEAAVQAAAHLG